MFFSKYYRTEAADVNTGTKTRPLTHADNTPQVKVLDVLDADRQTQFTPKIMSRARRFVRTKKEVPKGECIANTHYCEI